MLKQENSAGSEWDTLASRWIRCGCAHVYEYGPSSRCIFLCWFSFWCFGILSSSDSFLAARFLSVCFGDKHRFTCGSDGQPPPTKHACMRLLTIPGVFNTDTATRPRLLPHHPHHVRSPPPPGLLDHLPSLHPGTATEIFSQP